MLPLIPTKFRHDSRLSREFRCEKAPERHEKKVPFVISRWRYLTGRLLKLKSCCSHHWNMLDPLCRLNIPLDLTASDVSLSLLNHPHALCSLDPLCRAHVCHFASYWGCLRGEHLMVALEFWISLYIVGSFRGIHLILCYVTHIHRTRWVLRYTVKGQA